LHGATSDGGNADINAIVVYSKLCPDTEHGIPFRTGYISADDWERG